jgi:cyanophycinase-like exopeptidase
VVTRVCLQGGAEFGMASRDMDAALLKLTRPGPVVVVPLASPSGAAYQRTGAHAVGYYGELGASSVLVAADAREDDDAACAVVADAGLVVLPGGSPSRLLEVLTRTRLGLVLRDVIDDGGLVVGASAGAMCLAAWTLLPDQGSTVLPGLDVVPGALVLPHYDVSRRGQAERLLSGLPPATSVLCVPEQSGVLWESDPDGGAGVTAMGARDVTIMTHERAGTVVRTLEVGASSAWPPGTEE